MIEMLRRKFIDEQSTRNIVLAKYCVNELSRKPCTIFAFKLSDKARIPLLLIRYVFEGNRESEFDCTYTLFAGSLVSRVCELMYSERQSLRCLVVCKSLLLSEIDRS